MHEQFNDLEPHEFEIGSADGGKTWTVFEFDAGCSGQVCITHSKIYAEFIRNALNVCRDFSPYMNVRSMYLGGHEHLDASVDEDEQDVN